MLFGGRYGGRFGDHKARGVLPYLSSLLASRGKPLLLICGSFVVIFILLGAALTNQSRRSALLSSSKNYYNEHIDPLLHSPSSQRQPFERNLLSHNYALSSAQCDAYFPGLYDEIDKSVEHRKNRPIQEKELDQQDDEESNTRVMIYDGDLYIIADGDARPDERTMAMLNDLHRAIVADPERYTLPNIEFVFGREDWIDGKQVQWGWTKRVEDKDNWLVPDFGFWAWATPSVGSYQSVLRKIQELETQYPSYGHKIDKLIWRGSLGVGSNVREALYNQSRNQPWADVQQLDWPEGGGLPTNLIYIEDHCKYKYIAQTEGNSYSGRQKYIHNCNSVIVSHELGWIQPWHKFMVDSGTDQNYVRVELDFSDLDEKMRYYMERPELSAKIAENNVKTFRDRYLTPAAQACYWRKLIRGYASVSFSPRLYGETLQVNRSEDIPVQPIRHDMDFMTRAGKPWRGTPFENYAINGQMDFRAARRFGYSCFDEEGVRREAEEAKEEKEGKGKDKDKDKEDDKTEEAKEEAEEKAAEAVEAAEEKAEEAAERAEEQAEHDRRRARSARADAEGRR